MRSVRWFAESRSSKAESAHSHGSMGMPVNPMAWQQRARYSAARQATLQSSNARHWRMHAWIVAGCIYACACKRGWRREIERATEPNEWRNVSEHAPRVSGAFSRVLPCAFTRHALANQVHFQGRRQKFPLTSFEKQPGTRVSAPIRSRLRIRFPDRAGLTETKIDELFSWNSFFRLVTRCNVWYKYSVHFYIEMFRNLYFF